MGTATARRPQCACRADRPSCTEHEASSAGAPARAGAPPALRGGATAQLGYLARAPRGNLGAERRDMRERGRGLLQISERLLAVAQADPRLGERRLELDHLRRGRREEGGGRRAQWRAEGGGRRAEGG
eukprot:6891175-Prymnesium_polylepis.1